MSTRGMNNNMTKILGDQIFVEKSTKSKKKKICRNIIILFILKKLDF